MTHRDAERVLVVDDERVQRMVLARGLAGLGYQVDAAGTLAEAGEYLACHAYDVVLLDLSLGDAEGISLLPAIRDSVSDPAVVFVSGLDDRVRAASARLAGALGVRVAGTLRKPVSRGELRTMLRELPARTRARRMPPPPPPTARELAEALQWERIVAQYQPKISLATGAVVGVEALARWPLPTARLIAPDVFIPIAESTGLIVPLTFLMLRQSLEACQRWRLRHPGCSVAVNISPLVLSDPALPEEIERLLAETGLGPGALIAEITESTVIANPLVAAEILTRLRIKGVALSIDDFGTGHSSLLTLMRLPFSELKIDRSFIAACDNDPEAWKITRAMISMARELGLTVVAEGVESEAVRDMLVNAGCEIAQGWLFAKAMAEADLHVWLDTHAAAAA